jgi:hypothetical protein
MVSWYFCVQIIFLIKKFHGLKLYIIQTYSISVSRFRYIVYPNQINEDRGFSDIAPNMVCGVKNLIESEFDNC